MTLEKKIGQYRLLEIIGGGSFGTIYRALDNEGQEVAVKEFHLPQAPSNKHIELIDREKKIVEKLDHAKIPKFIDFVDEERAQYLVMELVKGEDLQKKIDGNQRFSDENVIDIALQVSEVLGYLHGQNPSIVHREVKPSSIMQRDDGTISLVDYGAVFNKTIDTMGGSTAIGTPGYLPLEAFYGHPEPKTDVYSLGATMFSLLSGKDPRDAWNFEDGIKVDKHLPQDSRLKDLIKGMTAVKVEERLDLETAISELHQLQGTGHLAVSQPRKVTFGEYLGRVPPTQHWTQKGMLLVDKKKDEFMDAFAKWILEKYGEKSADHTKKPIKARFLIGDERKFLNINRSMKIGIGVSLVTGVVGSTILGGIASGCVAAILTDELQNSGNCRKLVNRLLYGEEHHSTPVERNNDEFIAGPYTEIKESILRGENPMLHQGYVSASPENKTVLLAEYLNHNIAKRDIEGCERVLKAISHPSLSRYERVMKEIGEIKVAYDIIHSSEDLEEKDILLASKFAPGLLTAHYLSHGEVEKAESIIRTAIPNEKGRLLGLVDDNQTILLRGIAQVYQEGGDFMNAERLYHEVKQNPILMMDFYRNWMGEAEKNNDPFEVNHAQERYLALGSTIYGNKVSILPASKTRRNFEQLAAVEGVPRLEYRK